MPAAVDLKARFVFPVDGPVMEDGVVTVESGRIVKVGQRKVAGELVDLGNAAIVPGLVNAHTHLEFSDLSEPLGEQGMPMADWIRRVIGYRRARAEGDDAAARAAAITQGLAESARSGVRLIGEIGTSDAIDVYESNEPASVVFRELLGLSAQRTEELINTAREFTNAPAANHEPPVAELARVQNDKQPVAELARVQNDKPGAVRSLATSATRLDRVFVALSPHAPYTASPELVRSAAKLSAERGFPLAMHLAESLEELELLASHSGSLVELLNELEAWDPSAVPRGIRPYDYLELLAEAERALVIHGNYLSEEEIALVAARADRLSVVYCPRTHAFFGHGNYPLAEMLNRGVRVAFGTDSRASNPNLNLWQEAQFAAYRHTNVPLDGILRMATLNGAEALGLHKDYGSITPSKRAELTMIDLSESDGSEPYEILFRGEVNETKTRSTPHR